MPRYFNYISKDTIKATITIGCRFYNRVIEINKILNTVKQIRNKSHLTDIPIQSKILSRKHRQDFMIKYINIHL